MIIKTCRHCQEEFIVKRYGQHREHCYSRPCIELEVARKKIERYRLKNDWYKRKVAELKSQPMCKCCHIRPIEKPNVYLCPICFADADEQIEMYCGMGVDLEATTRRKEY